MPLGRSASAATAAHDRVAAAEASCHVGALRDYGDCLKPGTPDPDFFSRQFLWFFWVMISDEIVSDYSLVINQPLSLALPS